MVVLKTVRVILGAIFAVLILTILWIMILGIGMPKGSAVDIALLLHSPLYWLTFVAVVVLFCWLTRRWAFS